jgi:hypothetical protein
LIERSSYGTSVTATFPPVSFCHSFAAAMAGGATVEPDHTCNVVPLKSVVPPDVFGVDDGLSSSEPGVHALSTQAANGVRAAALTIERLLIRL